MNKILISIIITILLMSTSLRAQVTISSSSTQTEPSAGLNMGFTDKGFLMPRLSGAQIQAIENPATGLMVFNLSDNKPVFFDGSTWRNQDGTAAWLGCGNQMEVVHIAGVAAPVSKTVSYGTVTNIPGELNKCWITQNLGADRQATSVSDVSETSAGWYWQFNKLQGFKHDGTTRTPNTTWITWIGQNSDWTLANDPCNSEMGAGWRIPTETEWKNIKTGNGTSWTSWTGPWNSALKLHAAGRLNGEDGNIALRGSSGRYWSSANWSDTSGYMLCFNSSSCTIDSLYRKQWAGTLRCVKCIDPVPLAPLEGDHVPSQNQITWHWSAVEGALGYKWNTSNNYATAEDVGINTFKVEAALACTTNYQRYVWAYNDCEVSTVTVLTKSTQPCTWNNCGDFLTIVHVTSNNVAPVNQVISYGTVSGIAGESTKCWITKNLGATQQAGSRSDYSPASSGWYWQFNRKQGYYAYGSQRIPNTWVSSINEGSDWNSSSDPCTIELGEGWRIPSETEWTNVDNAGSWTNWDNPYNSGLKLHAAGLLNTSGTQENLGYYGRYWSGSQETATTGQALDFSSSVCLLNADDKKYGYSIRCIRCSSANPQSPTEGIHNVSYNQITWKWSSVPGVTGYKWSSTQVYSSAIDVGTDTAKLESQLPAGNTITRYVWAYDNCGPSERITLTASTLAYNWVSCNDSLTKNHVSSDVVPVNKIVTYGTIKNVPGDTSKCWINRNLGADRVATAKNDNSEASAGWYWQFNKKQGYKHDGSTRTPNTSWINSINDNTDWLATNDPCAIEIGDGWRIPTRSEWNNVDAGSNWTTWEGPWNSALKLHAAGLLDYYTGVRTGAGTYGHYWNSSQETATIGSNLFLTGSFCGLSIDFKTYGFSLRCVRCSSPVPESPSQEIHETTLTGITWNWSEVEGASGYKWNMVNDFISATDMGNVMTKTETGLDYGTSYSRYVWAYNDCGYSTATVLDTTTSEFGCGTDSLTIDHLAGYVAPVTKTVTYGTVSGIPGEPDKCWITSNLGADTQALAKDENTETAAGWYWQFNKRRGFKHDGTTRTPDTTWITSISVNSNWIAENDPCAGEMRSSWRVPTETEWFNVDAGGGSGAWTDWNGPWNSDLKIHAAGYLSAGSGSLTLRGEEGYYWSSTQETESSAAYLKFNSTSCGIDYNVKSRGYSIRCIKCLNSLPAPGQAIHIPSENQVVWHWNKVTGATGYKWNSTDNYSTALDLSSDTTHTETSMAAGTLYTRYVWAYNGCTHSGPATLSQSTSEWVWNVCGDSLTIQHTIGNVAPVDKVVTYGTISNIPGETAKCWITKNLGADKQATSSGDASEQAAGWYWQFNRLQGYVYGASRVPNTTWITAISENNGWFSSNDPCSLEIDSTWRLPTESEWYNVDNSGSWSNSNGTWNSSLKIHAAGYLNSSDGQLQNRGSEGRYWSNAWIIASKGWALTFNSTTCKADSIYSRSYGFSVRCLRCSSDTLPASPTQGTHTSYPNSILWKWNPVPGATGYKWNTVDNYLTAVNNGTSTQKMESGLLPGEHKAYVWAYTSCGHSEKLVMNGSTSPFVCGTTYLPVQHIAGNVAPVTKSVSYSTITNVPGEQTKCWINKNLGADFMAYNKNDVSETSAGWYWQFNRKQGYKHDGTIRTPSTGWVTYIYEYGGWSLANDPCRIELGNSFRIPTSTEWYNVDYSGGWTNWDGPWASPLHLHAAGYLSSTSGSLIDRGVMGCYWSGSPYYYWYEDPTVAYYFYFNANYSYQGYCYRTYGFPLRCIR